MFYSCSCSVVSLSFLIHICVRRLFFFVRQRAKAKKRPLLTEFHHKGELCHSLKTHGIHVAQVGHGRGLFPGSTLIWHADGRAAAVDVCVL